MIFFYINIICDIHVSICDHSKNSSNFLMFYHMNVICWTHRLSFLWMSLTFFQFMYVHYLEINYWEEKARNFVLRNEKFRIFPNGIVSNFKVIHCVLLSVEIHVPHKVFLQNPRCSFSYYTTNCYFFTSITVFFRISSLIGILQIFFHLICREHNEYSFI